MRHLYLLVILAAFSFNSCDDKVELGEGCTFPPPNSKWVTVDPNFNGFPCPECYIHISFDGKSYEFEDDEYDVDRSGYSEEHEYQRLSYINTFFNFTITLPDDEGIFDNALNQQTALVTYEEMFANDPKSLPVFTTYLRIEDYCRDRFDVAETRPSESFNIASNATETSQQEYLRGIDEDNLFQVRETFMSMTGQLKGYVQVNGEIKLIEVDYQIPVSIVERI